MWEERVLFRAVFLVESDKGLGTLSAPDTPNDWLSCRMTGTLYVRGQKQGAGGQDVGESFKWEEEPWWLLLGDQ